jgi:hypothetical protein
LGSLLTCGGAAENKADGVSGGAGVRDRTRAVLKAFELQLVQPAGLLDRSG